MLNWTKETPTEPGWYFVLYDREHCSNEEDMLRHTEVYRVFRHPCGGGLMVKIANTRQDVRFMSSKLRVHWAGPIPFPTDE